MTVWTYSKFNVSMCVFSDKLLIFIFWSDSGVITRRQQQHSGSLSTFCSSIAPLSGESKPWHLYALANTLWNKQSCEAEPGTNFISGCHL